tara:strand:- start:155 stop:349 length:195 start_codon:yes stop_codon:yes gene_type:complete
LKSDTRGELVANRYPKSIPSRRVDQMPDSLKHTSSELGDFLKRRRRIREASEADIEQKIGGMYR